MPLSKIQFSEATGRRNLVINGSFQVFQRATAATDATGYTTADRWHISETSDGAYTSERSTDTPFGTGYSVKLQCTTADTSLAASQFARVYQRIEGQNLQHLLYGTSSAKTLTLSFWVKSSKTGTYSILLRKEDSTGYHFIHSYTISSANTWEKKVITITPTAGSTSFITASAGAIANDNGIGLELAFNLAQGSQYAIGTSNTWSSDGNTYGLNGQVNWLDNTSNNLYLAQVQLEVGSLTEFEHRSFAEELVLCKRYYQDFGRTGNIAIGPAYPPSTVELAVHFKLVPAMRTTPSIDWLSDTSNLTYRYQGNNSQSFNRGNLSNDGGMGEMNQDGGNVWFAGWSHGISSAGAGEVRVLGGTTNAIRFDAEL